MKNCAFFARHGVLDEEERLGQRFYLDAELEVGLSNAIETDSIEGTVDYGAAFLEIEKVVQGRRRFLIEALALDVAKTLCDRFSAFDVRVSPCGSQMHQSPACSTMSR